MRVPVDTNPMSTVKCPMCDASFELALMIEGVVPSVELIDENLPKTDTPEKTISRKSVNAIDTPELFHVKSQQDYTPITEKKNGKFVVPKQLAKGVKKKKKRRRRSSRDGKTYRVKSAPSLNPDANSETTQNNDSQQQTEKLAANPSHTPASPSAPTVPSQNPTSQTTVDRVPTEHRRSGSGESSSKRSSSGEGASKRSSSSDSSKRRRSRSSSQRTNTKSKDAKIGLPFILIGAAIALPLTQVMMWWAASFDPFGMAPTVSRILPFAVPSSLAETEEDEAQQAETKAASANRNSRKKSSKKIVDPSLDLPKLPTPDLDPDSIYIDEDK